MSQAAVPNYVGHDFNAAAPGHRFNLYFEGWSHTGWKPAWVVDRNESKVAVLKKTLSVNPFADLLKNLRGRQRGLIENLPEAARFWLPAISTAPFATGLGNEHPVENGFAFLTPYGLPYLAGSSVKGVLRRAAEELALFGHPLPAGEGLGEGELLITPDIVDALFGPQDIRKPEDARRGALDVWDVFPQPPSQGPHKDKLAVEIMTPHYSDYYQGKSTPHDAGQPNPIPFLAVPAGSAFDFHVVCQPQRLPEHLRENWKDHLQAIFKHAFDWLGFGVKTAVGYGAMASKYQPQKQHTQPSSEVIWENATVAFSVSTRDMTATHGDKKAAKREAKPLFDALGSKGRQDKAKSGQLKASVKVRITQGQPPELLEILPPPNPTP